MIILVGASASGKTEVAKKLGKLFGVKKAVTHTTRAMRPGEINGIDYHFVSYEQFIELKNKDFFVETTKYNDNYYGTSKVEIANDKVLIVDPSGLKAFKKLNDPCIFSFFMHASRDVRYARMLERGDKEKAAKERIALDDAKFDPDIIKGIDFNINSETQSIRTVTIEVYETYAKKMLELDF
ncbi:MAG TPA: AAA family ATPase [Bacilli bacterium]|nr:AAA family ATPase [Bacilli bacterium]